MFEAIQPMLSGSLWIFDALMNVYDGAVQWSYGG